jgi:hypothetical protein
VIQRNVGFILQGEATHTEMETFAAGGGSWLPDSTKYRWVLVGRRSKIFRSAEPNEAQSAFLRSEDWTVTIVKGQNVNIGYGSGRPQGG